MCLLYVTISIITVYTETCTVDAPCKQWSLIMCVSVDMVRFTVKRCLFYNSGRNSQDYYVFKKNLKIEFF